MAAFGDEMDEFERAASAFPALDDDLDGFGAPVAATTAAPAPIAAIGSEPLDFDFDPLPSTNVPPVKVTGDDEITKFESQFPDVEVRTQFLLPYNIFYVSRVFGSWGKS
jgi:hypothetical protein